MKYPDIPISPFSIPFIDWPVHWYGITYLVAIGLAFLLLRIRARRADYANWTVDHTVDIVFYGALGVILGGRVGYVLFYNFSVFIADPMVMFRIWDGGMSFHGGILGVAVALYWYGRSQGKTFFEMTDYVVPVIAPGLGAGRIGNFINGELWGKVTDWPTGMQLSCSVKDAAGHFKFSAEFCEGKITGWSAPRHPSQLYEFFLEGVVLFIIVWWFSSKPRPRMAVSGLFLIGYGVFRFIVEFVRLPDAHIGYMAGWITRGHILTLPMIIVGAILMLLAYKRKAVAE